MIQLEPGDEVVQAVSYQNMILVFTRQGRIYKVYEKSFGQIVIEAL